MVIVEYAATPLCPAGHLPHKEGDRLAATFRPSLASRVKWCQSAQPISLLVGEMPGRAEGGSHTHCVQTIPFKPHKGGTT
ncbi:hypothetical protein ASF29_15570 [Rhizobium sp. Leaf262]|nr:hypothetical protein ASF29_15570 [Rhizobium sp. Leaf262]